MNKKSKGEVIADPLTRAEELLRAFEVQACESLQLVNNAVDAKDIDGALAKALEAHRRAFAFGHALFQITGKSIFRLSEKPLREVKIRARSIIIPAAPLPDAALAVLQDVKNASPAPKIFDGESEYQQWLKQKRMIEVDDDDHRSPNVPRWRELWD
jgi:hypothetical protein